MKHRFSLFVLGIVCLFLTASAEAQRPAAANPEIIFDNLDNNNYQRLFYLGNNSNDSWYTHNALAVDDDPLMSGHYYTPKLTAPITPKAESSPRGQWEITSVEIELATNTYESNFYNPYFGGAMDMREYGGLVLVVDISYYDSNNLPQTYTEAFKMSRSAKDPCYCIMTKGNRPTTWFFPNYGMVEAADPGGLSGIVDDPSIPNALKLDLRQPVLTRNGSSFFVSYHWTINGKPSPKIDFNVRVADKYHAQFVYPANRVWYNPPSVGSSSNTMFDLGYMHPGAGGGVHLNWPNLKNSWGSYYAYQRIRPGSPNWHAVWFDPYGPLATRVWAIER